MAGKKRERDLSEMSEAELQAHLRATREARRLADLREDNLRKALKAQKTQREADAKVAASRLEREAEEALTADYIDIAKAVLHLPEDWQRPGDMIPEKDKQRARMVFDACQRDPKVWARMSRPGSPLRPLGRVLFPEDPDAMFESGWFTDNDADDRHKIDAGLRKHEGSWYASDARQMAWGRQHMPHLEETDYAGVPPELKYDRFMELHEAEEAQRHARAAGELVSDEAQHSPSRKGRR